MTIGSRRLPMPSWAWSFLGAAAVWLVAAVAASGHGAGAMLAAALSFSVFSVLVGSGQMFVIASGPGNVDLSIPSVIAISGVVGLKLIGGDDAAIAYGLAAALAVGALVGLGNAALIRLLRIPPIIATLSMSLLVQSAAISYGRGLQVAPPPGLIAFVTARVVGLPLLPLLAVPLSLILGLILHRTVYGRAVLAIGQNPRAAALSGFNIGRTRLLTYVLSGLLAGLCGILLASFSGGASLDMGADYLMASIALVVIGGTSVSGGRANVTGIWGAAFFLYLLVAMLNSLGASNGLRLVLNGLIIIVVIAVAGGEKSPR